MLFRPSTSQVQGLMESIDISKGGYSKGIIIWMAKSQSARCLLQWRFLAGVGIEYLSPID
jgi:hypothetical protein